MASGKDRCEEGESRSEVTRRSFCVRACQAASVAAFGTVIPACGGGGGSTSPSPMVPQMPVIGAGGGAGVATVTLTGSPLATVGGAARVQTAQGQLLVARTAENSATAVTAICTHEMCTITGFEGQRYVCPCHGSQYTTDGAVLQGPATQSLRTFAASIAGDVLTIQLT